MNVEEIFADWSLLWLPPEDLPLSEWAEKNFVLSPEYSARTGDLRLFGWQRFILDSFTDPTVEELVAMCGTQLIKTLLIQVATAYVIAKGIGPELISFPKEDDAETFSKERIDPMIRDCPVLQGKVAPAKSRDGSNTTLFKRFQGGTLSLVGAGAPGNAARRSICVAACDEIDKYVSNVGGKDKGEGDFIWLVRERLVTYGSRRKLILACSPTRKHSSRIGKAYADTDQCKPWVACHACQKRQILKWAQVRWDNTLPREQRPATARYECEHCGARWNDNERWAAADGAEWRADRPFTGKRGVWINHLYSPWKKLSTIVADFLAAKQAGKEALQVFFNTTLAELWEEAGERPQWEILKGLSEPYPFGDDAVVPMRASFLTAAIDVQREWLAIELKAWGRRRENWSLGMWKLPLFDSKQQPIQTSAAEYWLEVDKFLAREWRHESGVTLPILAMGIDTGERPKPVYDYALRHPKIAHTPAGLWVNSPRTVIPLKGDSTQAQHWRLIVGVSSDDAARRRHGIKIVTVGGGFAKQEFYDCLQLRRKPDGTYPDGYCHLPQYEDWVFQGFCAEKRTVHENGSITWEKEYERNEPLDLHDYNRACASIVGIDRFSERQWAAMDERMGIKRDQPDRTPDAGPLDPVRPAAMQPVHQRAIEPVVSSNWMRGFLG